MLTGHDGPAAMNVYWSVAIFTSDRTSGPVGSFRPDWELKNLEMILDFCPFFKLKFYDILSIIVFFVFLKTAKKRPTILYDSTRSIWGQVWAALEELATHTLSTDPAPGWQAA